MLNDFHLNWVPNSACRHMSQSTTLWVGQNNFDKIPLMTLHFFIPAKGLNQEWSCFNIGNKLFADFFQKNISMAMPVKFLSLQSVGKVTNYLTSFSSAQSEDQQCRNVRMKQKLFWSCFIWISLLLKLPSNAKKKLGQSIFWKSVASLLGAMLVQHKPNPIGLSLGPMFRLIRVELVEFFWRH